MLFKNANIFVDGRFQHGSFRVENGRFSEILSAVPEEDGVDLENQYVIPGQIFQTAIMPASSKWHAILQKMA